MMSGQPRPLRVRDARALALRLAPRAASLAAPVGEAELLLARLGSHGDQGTRRAWTFARIEESSKNLDQASLAATRCGLGGVASPRRLPGPPRALETRP